MPAVEQAARLTDLRVKSNFSSRIKLFLSVQSLSKKYFASRFAQITCLSPAIPFRERGVGHRHERWSGLRWTLTVLETKAPDADGEVVWS